MLFFYRGETNECPGRKIYIYEKFQAIQILSRKLQNIKEPFLVSTDRFSTFNNFYVVTLFHIRIVNFYGLSFSLYRAVWKAIYVFKVDEFALCK